MIFQGRFATTPFRLFLFLATFLVILPILQTKAELNYPKEAFWSSTRKHVAWAAFMAETIYQKCDQLQKTHPTFPIPKEHILATAMQLGADAGRHGGDWNVKKFLRMLPEKYAQYQGNYMKTARYFLVRVGAPGTCMLFSMVSAAIFLLALVTCCRCGRR